MQEVKTVLLKCKNCGGVLNGDEDGDNIIECPFCGSKELIVESDAVKIARIKAEKEVELGRQKLQAEELKTAKKKAFNRSGVFRAALVFLFISAIGCMMAFSSYALISGIISIVQLGLLAAAIVIGIKKKNRSNLPRYFVIAAAVLIIPYAGFIGEQNYALKARSQYSSLDWSSLELSSMLPDPGVTSGRVYNDSELRLRVESGPYTKEQFKDYVSKCKQLGFTIDQYSSYENSYEAYNDEGYHLELYFYSSGKELSIELDAPIEMSSYVWPTHGLAKLLPAPPSDVGKITSDSDEYFFAYIGEISKDDYSAYVDECIAAGFDVEYDRSEKYYSAKNSDGVSLRIYYEGFKTISIRISDYKD